MQNKIDFCDAGCTFSLHLSNLRWRYQNLLSYFVVVMSGRFKEFLPLFQLINGHLLSDRELSRIVQGLGKQAVNVVGEIAFNFCVAASVPLTDREKKYLRRFQSPLAIIANKKTSLTHRRNILTKNPKLLRYLSKIAEDYLYG